MFCRYCGAEMDENDVFCTACGKPVSQTGDRMIANNNPAPVQYPNYGNSYPGNGGQQNNAAISTNRMSTLRLVCIGCCVLLAISCFLPFMSALGLVEISLIDGDDGYIVLGAAGIGLLGALTKEYIVTILAGLAGAGVAMYDGVLSNSSKYITRGAGFYIMILSSIVMVVVGVLASQEKKKIVAAKFAEQQRQ